MAVSEKSFPTDHVHVPELEELGLEDRPDGPGAAVILAAGLGIFVLGLLTTLAEASESIKGRLEDFQGSVAAGPLAGKTILASLTFAVAWLILGLVWRRRELDIQKWFWIALALGILGAIGTFPTFFQAFEP